jgi:hypothetical protein
MLCHRVCLGSTKNIAENKLMFGFLAQDESVEMKDAISPDRSYGAAVRYVAFGIEGSVVRLRKGEPWS